nr:class I SAM-dependent methyltransferase [uncultured Noviherbaspirillum sp.]
MTSVSYYDQNANDFFAATVGADMADTRDRFLSYLPLQGHVLDAGCGSGRDAACFLQAGYKVTAFDASKEMVVRATSHSGLPVLHLTFEDIAWTAEFDGIWACASLLHVAEVDLPYVINKLAMSLRPNGILYGSFKYGEGYVERDGRRFTNQTEESLAQLMKGIPSLLPVDMWISHDVRPGRTDQWLNFLYQDRM